MTTRRLPPLPTRLTHQEADAFLRRCRDEGQAGGSAQTGVVWQIDAAALEVFDSAALAALLAVARLAHRSGARLQVQSMPRRLQDLAALYGVSELLPT